MTDLSPPSSSARTPRAPSARTFAATTTVVLVAGAILGANAFVGAVAVVGCAAVAALLMTTRRHPSFGTNPWLVFSAAVAILAAGATVAAGAGLERVPAPPWSDWMMFAGCGLIVAAVAKLGGVRSDAASRTAALDAAVIGAAAVMVLWVALVAPTDVAGSDWIDRLTTAALPVRGGLLVAILGWIAFTPGRRSPMASLALGVSALLVADVLSASAQSTSLDLTTAITLLRGIGLLGLGLVGCVGGAHFRSDSPAPGPTRERVSRSLVIGIALLVGPAATVAGDLTTTDGLIVIGAGSTLLAVGVMARFVNLVHQNQRAHDETAASERRFRMLADSAPVGIFEIGRGMQVTYSNAEGARLLGSSLVGSGPADVARCVAERSQERFRRGMDDVAQGVPATMELQLAPPSPERWVLWQGVPVQPAMVGLPAAFASLLDITELKQAESALARQATHDPLTGLPNRRLLIEALIVALEDLGRGHRTGTVALMFIDLDGFKLVNDLMGHDVGDALLTTAASRLRNAVRAHDMVARFGGDEFVVLMQHVADRGELHDVAQRILHAVSAPIDVGGDVGGDHARVGASIGIATASGPDDDPDALVRNADAAMYKAKEHGRGRYEFFRPDQSAAAHRML